MIWAQTNPLLVLSVRVMWWSYEMYDFWSVLLYEMYGLYGVFAWYLKKWMEKKRQAPAGKTYTGIQGYDTS